jgi:hypothetical protein
MKSNQENNIIVSRIFNVKLGVNWLRTCQISCFIKKNNIAEKNGHKKGDLNIIK